MYGRIRLVIKFADVAELADVPDLGFYTNLCEFAKQRNSPKKLAFSAVMLSGVDT